MIKFNNYFKITFLLLVIAESLSLLGYVFPPINQAAFFIIIITAIAISAYKLEYGLLIILTELIVGSKGYLFYFNFYDANLSIRIALWLIIMSVWFVKKNIKAYKDKTAKDFYLPIIKGNNKYLLILMIVVFAAGLNGLLRHNQISFVFDEFKRWAYFLLFLPLLDTIKSEETIERIMSVIWAALSWLCLKTLMILFIFSHEMLNLVYPLYRWVRTTGVGEITNIQGGFYRVFFQSHIYCLLLMFIPLISLINKISKNNIKTILKDRDVWLSYSALTILLAVVLVSFSRSFWVGLAGGLFLSGCYLIYLNYKNHEDIKNYLIKILNLILIFFSSLILSLLIIFAIVKFPYPNPLGGFDATDLFSERATETDESAIGSRWALLPRLWQQIADSPVTGKGFGTTVTYQSQDPRVLSKNINGTYTTYAFEWGWLDIWLKLGIIGLLSYLILLGIMIYDIIKINKDFKYRNLLFSFGLGIMVLSIVNFFTPYLNHPLGIGFLILVLALINFSKKTIAQNNIL